MITQFKIFENFIKKLKDLYAVGWQPNNIVVAKEKRFANTKNGYDYYIQKDKKYVITNVHNNGNLDIRDIDKWKFYNDLPREYFITELEFDSKNNAEKYNL